MFLVWLFLRIWYERVSRWCAAFEDPLLLVVRLYFGCQLAQTGWGKLMNHDHVVEFFTTLNLPAPSLTAWFVSVVELGGGVFLTVGVFSRLTALVILVNMFVAYWLADREALMSFIRKPDKFTAADPFLYLFVALLILVLGPGDWSADRFFMKKNVHTTQR